MKTKIKTYSSEQIECNKLAEIISKNRREIIELLSSYETFETTIHQINQSINTLKGATEEYKSISDPKTNLNISAFFPLNLPLYSLIIYGAMLHPFVDNIYIRPPRVMGNLLDELAEILGIGSRIFPKIQIKKVPRHIFVDLYTNDSDVIIFTGKYENALEVHKNSPHALLIYEGSGVSPFLVYNNADIDLAVDKAVAMRCFNSGQDCVAPDAIFVPESKLIEFNTKLTEKIEKLIIGDTRKRNVNIGRIIKLDYLHKIDEWLLKENKNLLYGGIIDIKNQIVTPTIISKKVTEHTGDFHEFFAPIFYVLSYKSETELYSIFKDQFFMDHSMYLSTFGSPELSNTEKLLSKVTILRNINVNDAENGNLAYGGYGVKSNCIIYGDNIIAQPLLLSRDINLNIN